MSQIVTGTVGTGWNVSQIVKQIARGGSSVRGVRHVAVTGTATMTGTRVMVTRTRVTVTGMRVTVTGTCVTVTGTVMARGVAGAIGMAIEIAMSRWVRCARGGATVTGTLVTVTGTRKGARSGGGATMSHRAGTRGDLTVQTGQSGLTGTRSLTETATERGEKGMTQSDGRARRGGINPSPILKIFLSVTGLSLIHI